MKNPRGNALRWLRQAEFDLEQASRSLKDGVYSYAAFFAEQSAQKSLKAVRYFDGARFIFIHSVSELVKEVSENRPEFLPLKSQGAILDQYYITTRYPDAVAEPAIPSEIFSGQQAEDAVRIARAVLDKCRAVIR